MSLRLCYLFISLLLMTGFFSCNKQKAPQHGKISYHYTGQAHGSYEHIEYHFEGSGSVDSITWDSTYQTFVNVDIDYDLKKIKFSVQQLSYYFPDQFVINEYVFDYEEEKSDYEEYLSISNITQFRITGGALTFSCYYFTGKYGPDHTTDKTQFTGVRSY